MKYMVRYVGWYYDEWDTTLCDVYGIEVEAGNPNEAREKACAIAERYHKMHTLPDGLDLEFIQEESGRTYVPSNGEQWTAISNAEEKEVVKPPYKSSYCSNGETWYNIKEDGIAKFISP